LAACAQTSHSSSTHSSQPREVATQPAPQQELSGPRQYDLWRLQRWLDEDGNPPARDALHRARVEAKANADFWDMTDGGGIGRFGWTELGPDNIGGRTRSLVIHPTITSRMWAGSVGGGIWRSDNSGASWYPLDDWMGNLAIGCLTMDPNSTSVMYAGTGEGFGNFDAIRGEGIWKTTDGGTTWLQLASTVNFGSINRIVVSPVNSDLVIASTRWGIRRSTDGGTTWTTVRSGNSLQVIIDPNNSNNYLAHVSETGTHRVVRSTDAGVNWTNATTGLNSNPGRIELCYAPSVSNRVYASTSFSSTSGNPPVTTTVAQFWRSTDGGVTWTQRTATNLSSGQIWYNNALWVDPTNSSRVIVGMTRVFRTTDGGTNFTVISNGGMNASTPHSDVHFFRADPGYNGTTNKTLYVCTDGGCYRTTDITTATTSSGWTRRDGNYRTVQYHGTDGHSTGRVAGGTQDNGTLTLNSGSLNATLTAGADGGYTQIDPTDPNFIWGETQNLGVHRSTDGGLTSSGMTSGLADAAAATRCTNFIAPLVLSPFNSNILYAGGCSLWRCSNAKAASPTWTNIKASVGSNISAIAVSSNSSNVVWIGHNNGRVYRTTNALSATPTWTTVDDNGTSNPLPGRAITRILIDRTNNSRVYVCLGGFSGTNVQRTTDNGVTFADVTGFGTTGLPSAPVYGIAQHPTLNGRYYVGTEVGVFGTSDDCATWSTTNDGPADVSCIEVSFLHGSSTLLTGTHGRGMWTTTIHEPSVSDIGAGCAGTNGTPSLAATDPRIGLSVTITANNLVPNQPVWLGQGQSSSSWFGNLLPADLTAFGAPGCFLRIRPDIVRDGFSDGWGNFSGELPIAANTSLLGRIFYLQLFPGDLAANAFGRTASNALQMVIGH